MELLTRVKKILDYVENPETPLLYPILLFFSSITLRNFLEIFSNRAVAPFRFLQPTDILSYLSVWLGLAVSLLHFYAFWLTLALAVSLVFYFLTGEDITKVLKTVLSFFIIIIATPLVDLAITDGRGLPILYAEPKSLLELLPFPNVLTPGMYVTASSGIILSLIYCWAKTGKITKGLAASFSLYALLVAGSILPLLLKTSAPIPIIRALLVAIIIESACLFFIKKRSWCLAILKDTRWPRALYFYCMFALGIMLTRQPVIKVLLNDPMSLALIIISLFLCWTASIMFNNIEDKNADAVNSPQRPTVNQAIPQDAYRAIALCCLCFAGIMALGVNYQYFFLILLLTGNSLLYSLPPLRLKRLPIFSKLFISLNSLIMAMIGFIFAGGELLEFPPAITWYFLAFVTLAAQFIDIKDYEGDKKSGLLTLPVIFGLKRGKLFIGALTVIAYAMAGVIFLDAIIVIGGIILGAAQFLIINRKNYQDRIVIRGHIISLVLLIVYLRFSPRSVIIP